MYEPQRSQPEVTEPKEAADIFSAKIAVLKKELIFIAVGAVLGLVVGVQIESAVRYTAAGIGMWWYWMCGIGTALAIIAAKVHNLRSSVDISDKAFGCIGLLLIPAYLVLGYLLGIVFTAFHVIRRLMKIKKLKHERE